MDQFFRFIIKYPKRIFGLSILIMLIGSGFLAKINIDTSTEAFIPPQHSSVIYRQQVKEVFGLKDPMVMAVVNNGQNGIYTPATLNLIDTLTQKIQSMSVIRSDRVKSIATEKNIFGSEDGMEVDLFYEAPLESLEQANEIKKAVMSFPIYVGSLVSEDGTMALIVAEMAEMSENDESNAYAQFTQLAQSIELHDDEKLYVAGDNAVEEYYGKYILMDCLMMIPLVNIITSIILLIAYRTFRGLVLPNLVILAACGLSLGIMAAADVAYYNITNALPVLLVAICVADGIHIIGEYYEQAGRNKLLSQNELVLRTMSAMWRPVVVTSITDIAGFTALTFSSVMPPLRYFGLIASIGVAVACIYSLVAIPAGLALLKPQTSPAFVPLGNNIVKADRFGLFMQRFGHIVTKKPTWSLFFVSVVLIFGVTGAFKLQVDESRIENFQQNEPIYVADSLINERLDGTAYLDVVIETPENEDLFKINNIKKIEKLQEFLLTLPHVQSATSYVDFLKQMNKGMNKNDKTYYSLPDNADMVAQYLLLYTSTSSPEDFEEYIDYNYRLANIRVVMNSGWHSDFVTVIESAHEYIDTNFTTSDISVKLAGRVNVDYHWINGIATSHFKGVIFATIAILIVISLFLRSLYAGIIAVVPVLISVMLIYAWMGFFEMPLAITTSMFAAITLGCGVDFSVHTLDRLIVLMKDQKNDIDSALEKLFASTGRSLLFNFAAIFSGFLVMQTSQIPTINQFGVLVCVSVFVSFAASLIVLPALVKAIKPGFLFNK